MLPEGWGGSSGTFRLFGFRVQGFERRPIIPHDKISKAPHFERSESETQHLDSRRIPCHTRLNMWDHDGGSKSGVYIVTMPNMGLLA